MKFIGFGMRVASIRWAIWRGRASPRGVHPRAHRLFRKCRDHGPESVGMDELEKMLATVAKQELAAGELRGLLHILIGRSVSCAFDGPTLSPGELVQRRRSSQAIAPGRRDGGATSGWNLPICRSGIASGSGFPRSPKPRSKVRKRSRLPSGWPRSSRWWNMLWPLAAGS